MRLICHSNFQQFFISVVFSIFLKNLKKLTDDLCSVSKGLLLSHSPKLTANNVQCNNANNFSNLVRPLQLAIVFLLIFLMFSHNLHFICSFHPFKKTSFLVEYMLMLSSLFAFFHKISYKTQNSDIKLSTFTLYKY